MAALISLSPYAPDGTVRLVFVFENVWSPEGAFRYTMWRKIRRGELLPAPANFVGSGGKYLVIHCDPNLITKRGSVSEKVERYFSEPTIDAFSFEIYDAPSLAWLRIADQWTGISQIDSPFSPQPFFELSEQIHERLFTKWIKPLETDEVYGMIEFKPDEEDNYSIMVCGQLQNAVDGVDHKWKHRQPSPYLDNDLNTVYDADRTWTLKFVPVTTAGLGKCPARPTRNSNGLDDSGTSTWTIPFFDSAIDHTKFPNAVSSLPFETLNGLTCIQACNNTWDSTFSLPGHNQADGRWNRHINIRKVLSIVFDYCYGEGNWTVTCDDSPFTFFVGEVASPFIGGGAVFGLLESVGRIPNFALQKKNAHGDTVFVGPEQWVLIPECLFGLYDLLGVDPNNPAPTVAGSWPKRFKSAWEWIQELAYTFGYAIKVQTDDTVSPPVAHIQFINKLMSVQPQFTTIVPTEATPQAFPESENGIKLTLASPFRHAAEADKTVDDWLAMRSDTPISTFVGEVLVESPNSLVITRQVNPYIVPSTAQNAAELQVSMALMGPATGVDQNDLNKEVAWYSLSLSPFWGNASPFLVERTQNFPTLAPLMLDSVGFSISPARNPIPPGSTIASFSPLFRAAFTYTFADGSTSSVICDSLRQLLARFYSLFYVKSAFKYTCRYPTINKFKGGDTSPVPNKHSWKNIQTHFRCQLFEPVDELYYVKELVRDLDAMQTTSGYLQDVRFNRNFENNNTLDFQDGSELTGSVTNSNPGGIVIGITPNDSGGSINPGSSVVRLNSATPAAMPDATLYAGHLIIVYNAHTSLSGVTFIAGQGTDAPLAPNQVLAALSDGVVWQPLLNALPGYFSPAPVTPTHTASPGLAGQVAVDSGNMYLCIAANTWLKFTSGGPF